MFNDNDDTDLLRMQATQYRLPAYEAIVSDPKKGMLPIAVVVGLSFLGLRWLLKGSL